MTEDLPDLTLVEDLPDLAAVLPPIPPIPPVRLVLSEVDTAAYVAHCVREDEIDWSLR